MAAQVPMGRWKERRGDFHEDPYRRVNELQLELRHRAPPTIQ
jgi:hypothetical protein